MFFQWPMFSKRRHKAEMVLKAVKLSASAEDYLLTIFLLSQKDAPVRVRDIGNMLHVSASSVTEYIKKLSTAGLVHYVKYRGTVITAEGEVLARDIHLRYELLRKLLSEILGVPSELAEQEAKNMKHTLSDLIKNKLAGFIGRVLGPQPARELTQ